MLADLEAGINQIPTHRTYLQPFCRDDPAGRVQIMRKRDLVTIFIGAFLPPVQQIIISTIFFV